MAERPAYRVIEPTFSVEGGTPVDGLAHRLNEARADGYRFAGTTRVREPGGQWVDVIVFERIEV